MVSSHILCIDPSRTLNIVPKQNVLVAPVCCHSNIIYHVLGKYDNILLKIFNFCLKIKRKQNQKVLSKASPWVAKVVPATCPRR